jgi:RecG-like helicase
MGLFRKVGDLLQDNPDEEDAPKLRAWSQQMPGVDPIKECRPRAHRRVAGVVESIKLTPRTNTCLLQIEIYDGTDRIKGVWYGRRKIPGVDLGRRLVLEGTVADLEGTGLQMINPEYELVPA